MKRLFFMLIAATVCLVCQPRSVQAENGVVWEFFTNRDYRGSVQRGAVDAASGEIYLATMATLYGVHDGEIFAAAERPKENARLHLAPGGGVYAWLIPYNTWDGLFSVRLMQVPDKQIAELRFEEFPHGFSALYLGFQGKLVVTATPLEDWQSLTGRFRYTFWSRDGRALKKLEVPGQQVGILDGTGTTILFLGQKAVTAFSASGKQLWQLPGQFRKAAVAKEGKLALLNPASRESINQVVIFGGSGEPAIVTLPTAVHHLALTPDGAQAAVIGDSGRYFFLDTATGDIKDGPALPLDAVSFVSDVEFLDTDTLVLGALQRTGEPPQHTWPSGSIIVIDRGGRVVFQKKFPISEPVAFVPAIDATFESELFIGFTQDTALLVKPGR
jgi:hypothetical protein